MPTKRLFSESQLASLAKQYRVRARRNRSEAARELAVARQAVIYAEDHPAKSFTKLRIRMIEAYSCFVVTGPMFQLTKRTSTIKQ